MSAIVFSGPTVDTATVREMLPEADCRPPAAQGDVYAASRLRPTVIALIDGVFLDRPAVWHREILAALQQGITVVGASSMGALRAAECHAFGMAGFGKIFNAFVDGSYPSYTDGFEDDDEVAVIHGPAELGSPPLSDALVDLRETLARARAAGAIDRQTRDALVARLKSVFFAERSFALMKSMAVEGLEPDRAADLGASLERHRCSQKREDALDMLSVLADDVPDVPPMAWRFERTIDWERFVEELSAPPLNDAERRALRALAEEPSHERLVERRAVARMMTLDAAEGGNAHSVIGEFRIARGLMSRQQLDRWTEANALSPAAFVQLLEDEAALDTLVRSVGRERLAQAVVDELRLEGSFVSLSRDRSVGATP